MATEQTGELRGYEMSFSGKSEDRDKLLASAKKFAKSIKAEAASFSFGSDGFNPEVHDVVLELKADKDEVPSRSGGRTV